MFANSRITGRRRRIVAGAVALASIAALTACEPFTERSTLSGFGPPGESQTGHAVAISRDGLTMAVGSPTGYGGSGFVTVFTRQATSVDWKQEVVLAPTTSAFTGSFGFDVDLSANGDALVVGIPDNAQSRGRAASYFRSEGEWSDPYVIKRDQAPEVADKFGSSVAISADGKRIVVGSPSADDSGKFNVGRITFFDFDGASWLEKFSTVNTSVVRQAYESFGTSVDMNDAGNLVVVGAPLYDRTSPAITDAGRVAVMSRQSNGTWTSRTWLTDENASTTSTNQGPRFGTAVSLSGDGRVLAVGARGEDVSSKADSGAVLVLADGAGDGSTWSVRQRITQASESAWAGFSVGLDTDGSHLMVGAYGYNTYAGLASLWIFDGTKYVANAYKVETGSGSSGLGSAVAISGDGKVMAAGASLANNLVGLVRTFDLFKKPGKPTGAKGTASDAAVLVEWTAPADNGGLAPSYTVVSTPGSLTCVTTTTSCIVSGLTNDTAYTFVVTPTNGAGVGAASDASAAVTPKAAAAAAVDFGTVPSEPRTVSAVPGWKRATVSWTAPESNGGKEVQSYEVTSSPDGLKCVTTTETSCVITGLRPRKSYSFSVVAVNINGASKAAETRKYSLQPKVSLRGGPTKQRLAIWQGISIDTSEVITLRLRGKVARANCKIVDGRLYAKIAGTQCKVTVKARYEKTLTRTVIIQTVRR